MSEVNPETVRRAYALQVRIDELLNRAKRMHAPNKTRMGSVNWGDLSCSGVELIQEITPFIDKPYLRAVIEEASAECNLAAWVYRHLADEGWDNIEIVCEW